MHKTSKLKQDPRKRRVMTVIWIAAFLLALPASVEALYPVFSTLLGGAIRGYDPVAYFTENQPIKGKKAFSHQWKNATWRFASARNRQLFRTNPQKYAPQYGGYCAYAVSQGYTASINPHAWKIVEGKLYLNYSKGVQRLWEENTDGHIKRADENWPRILAQN